MNVDDEPTITEWTESTYPEVLTMLSANPRQPGIVLIGVDGRSGSGKSTFAAQLARTRVGVAVVHTDDIAWHHSFFDWHELLVDGVLSPLRRDGPPIRYRPPPWDLRGRDGFVDVPADTEVVLVEGVGSCRRNFSRGSMRRCGCNPTRGWPTVASSPEVTTPSSSSTSGRLVKFPSSRAIGPGREQR